jgi:hypothetical protein
MTTLRLTLWAWFNKLNRTLRSRMAIIAARLTSFLSAPASAPWFNKLNRKLHDHMAITITGVIVFLSAPALALMSYGVYAFLGASTTSNDASHKVAIPVAITWAVNTNRENKGDRIIPSAAETVQQRFIFDDVSNVASAEKVPLPRRRPDELIALDAPPIDLQPALDRNRRQQCEWEKLKRVPDAKLETLPDFMTSCLGPPTQLTPPNR